MTNEKILLLYTYTSRQLLSNVSFFVTSPLDGSLSTRNTSYATSASFAFGKGIHRFLCNVKVHSQTWTMKYLIHNCRTIYISIIKLNLFIWICIQICI